MRIPFGQRRLGEHCTETKDCKIPFVCAERICKCPAGSVELNSEECRFTPRAVPPGSWCNTKNGLECSGGSRCHRNVCICAYGHIVNGLSCSPAPKVPPGSQCKDGDLCAGEAFCSQGVCRCPNEETIPNQKCQNSRKRRDSVRHRDPPQPTYPANTPPPPTRPPPAEHYSPQPIRNHQQSGSSSAPDCPLNGHNCTLPHCFCSRTGLDVPGELESADVPQMVLLTFSDPITDRTINSLKAIFNGRYRNPNGCPIKATFFVTHDYSNYDQVQWLYSQGHEMAVSSMTGDNNETKSESEWEAEMAGTKKALEKFSYVDGKKVIGVRAPQMRPGGDAQYRAMLRGGFRYDSSTLVTGGPYWPQTMDHRPPWQCVNGQRCPLYSYPGLWEFTINEFYHPNGSTGNSLHSVVGRGTAESVFRVLSENFNRSESASKAPFVVPISSELLTSLPDSGAVNGIQRFLESILKRQDVYVVSMSQALDWITLPTRLAKIRDFRSWNCQRGGTQHVRPCETPSVCSYMAQNNQATGMPRSFRICGSCPRYYPWVRDPLGEGTRQWKKM
jgi:hypothetical protein